MKTNYEMLTEKIIIKEPTAFASARSSVSANPYATEYPWQCPCYKDNSPDARCCGLCYYCCRAAHINKEVDRNRCDFCPNDFHEYWYSGYVQTTAGYGNKEEDINGVYCWCCFPLKFSMFFFCCLGSICNNIINKCCATTCCSYLGHCSAPIRRNYLF